MNTYKEIKTEIRDKSLIIFLSRPEKMNTFTKNMQEEIVHALDEAEKNDDIRSIIFTGDGKAFCAGADLSSGGDTFDSSSENKKNNVVRDSGGLLTLRLFKSTKPLIGAINGVAVGIGATMLLPMDVRTVSYTHLRAHET